MKCSSLFAVTLFLLVTYKLCPAQDTEAPAAESQPVARVGIAARVIEIRGKEADWSKIEPEGVKPVWQPLKNGDPLPEGTQVRTGPTSSVKLQLGAEAPYTAMIVEPSSRALLTEAGIEGGVKKIRVGVGYGKIRAGVAEGGLKSDFTVDSPVATLSKRGTWNFGMSYERGSDRFEVFLVDRGLVEALNKITLERREVSPGTAVTQAMRRWFDESQLRDQISVSDLLGQSPEIRVTFNRLNEQGLRVLDPSAGRSAILDLTNAGNQQRFSSASQQGNFGNAAQQFTQAVQQVLPGQIRRVEGYFGTGRGGNLIPVVINANSPSRTLVKRNRR